MPRLVGCFHVATSDDRVLIRVEGYATSHNSLLFKDFAEEMSKQGFCDFIVDLSACKTMDSTFLGVLVGFLNEHPTGQTRLTLVNINEYHRNLLDNLGISRILTIKSSSFLFPNIITKTLQEEYYDPRKRMEMIRDAHRALVALNDKNRKLFQEFLDLMDAENPPVGPCEQKSP